MSPPQVIHKRSPPLLHMGCVKIFSNKTAVLTAVFEYEMYSPIPTWSNMAYMSGLWIAAYCQSVIRAQLRHDLIRLTVAGGEVLRPRQVSQLSTYPT